MLYENDSHAQVVSIVYSTYTINNIVYQIIDYSSEVPDTTADWSWKNPEGEEIAQRMEEVMQCMGFDSFQDYLTKMMEIEMADMME